MKVLMVGTDSIASGAGLSMIALSEQLRMHGVQTVLAVKNGNTERVLKERGIAHYVVDGQNWVYASSSPKIVRQAAGYAKRLLNVAPNRQISKIVRQENPDIVHINAVTSCMGARAALAHGSKLVWHIRELLEEGLDCSFANPHYSKKLIGKADALIAISNAVANKYAKAFPNQKIHTIYNGVDIDVYRNEQHEILHAAKPVVTIAGRITKNKGQAEVLLALAELLRASRIELWIAGTGTNKDVSLLHDIVTQEGIPAQCVRFFGYVDDMPSIWSKTDVAITASRCEAFGRTTVEAMASGCLVIGSDTGGTPELIRNGKTGLIYRQGDRQSLPNSIALALDKPHESRKMARAGREHACREFNSKRNAEEIIKVYESIL